mmetsp:Transcript_59860/g.147054  ORF Transcript_59860/g.147054 Transcript_59860/m.147054 type:complete len:2082 (-) Transcript_59860:233-6478(-)
MASAATPANGNVKPNEDDGQEGITVAIRMRPLNKTEGQNERIWKVLPKYSSVAQTTREGKPLGERITGRTFFTFDKTFGEETNNRQVYDSVAKGIVTSVVEGLNGTIFAYGQTSSGKTFTMQGSGNLEQGTSSNDSSVGGVVHMAAKDIFSQIQQEQDRMFLVRVSFLEIYNEEVRDLLSSDTSQTLQIREDPRRGVFVQSVEEVVTDFETLLGILIRGDKSRTFASTGMNERSSRSHTILRVTIESRQKEVESDENDVDYSSGGDGAVRLSTLNLVDLAGSESVRHTGATGARQKEGGLINQSLLTLSRVIVALGNPDQQHVNFRDSKLTRILQPSLSGNARMAVICCATPSELYLEETRSTLQFASRAKLVKTNAQVNEVIDERSMIRRLQRELAEAKRLQSGPGQEEYRDLEEKVANAGTQAMEAKAKLDRLKASILNVGYLFEQPVDFNEVPTTHMERNVQKKRRKSDGPLLLHSSPSKVAGTESKYPTPKTAPRSKKTKTLSRQSIAVSDELSMIREALSGRNEFILSLKTTIADHSDQIHQKNLDIERMLEQRSVLTNEMSGARSEMEALKNMVSALQQELEVSSESNEEALLEKESIIVETFEKMQKSVVDKEQLEADLADLRSKFDQLQEERVRSAFELAEMTSERENLLAERQDDKTKLQDMAGKTEFLTTNLNEVTKKREETMTEVEELKNALILQKKENDKLLAEKAKAIASVEELAMNLGEFRKSNEDITAINEAMEKKVYDLEKSYAAASSENTDLKGEIAKEKEQSADIEGKLLISTEDNEQLKQELKSSEVQIAEARSEIEILHEKAEGSRQSEESLVQQVQDLQNQLDKTRVAHSDSVQNHEKVVAAAGAAMMEVKEHLLHAREENTKNLETIEELEMALCEFERSKQHLEEEVKCLKIQKDDLDVQLTAHQQQIRTLESGLSALKDENDVVTAEKNSLEAVLNNLKQQLGDMETHLSTAEDELSRLRTEKDALVEENSTAFAELEKQKSEAAEELTLLRTTSEELNKERSELEGLVSQREHDKMELEMTLQQTQHELNTTRAHIEELHAQVKESSSTVKLLQEEVVLKNNMLESIQADKETTTLDLKGLLSVSNQAKEELQAEVDRLTSSLEMANELIKTEEKSSELVLSQSTVTQQELERCQADLLEVKHDHEVMKKALQIRISEQAEVERDLKQRKTEIISLQHQIETVVTARSTAEDAFFEVKHSMEGLEAENEDMCNTLSELQEEKNEIEMVLATVTAECENLKQVKESSKVQLEDLNSKLEASRDELKELDERLQNTMKSRDSLAESLKERENERDEAASEVERLYKSNKQLESQLAKSIPKDDLEQMDKDSSKEQEEIIELKQLLVSVNEAEERARSALAAAEHEVEEKTTELKDAIHRQAELEEELCQQKSIQNEPIDSEASHCDLMQRIEDLESEKSQLERALDVEKQSRAAHEENLKQQMGEEQRALLQEGDAMMAELRSKIEIYETKVAEAEAEAYNSRQQVEEITDELKTLQEEYEKVKGLKSQLEHAIAQQESLSGSLKEDLEQQKTECYNLKESVINMKEKVRRSNRDIEKASRASEMATSELAVFQRKYKSLETQLESSRSEITRLKKKSTGVSHDSEETIQHLKSEVLNKDTKIEQIESKIADLTRANEEAGKEISKLRLAEKEKSVKSLPRQQGKDVDRLKEELKKKDERIEELKKHRLNRKQMAEIKKMKDDNGNYEKVCAKLERECAQLKKTISSMQTDTSEKGGESKLQDELNQLRFDNEAIESKLRKYVIHCQRLEEDKAGMINSLQSCNVDLDSFHGDLNEAVIHLCDRLTSLDGQPNNNRADILEDENESLRRQVEVYVQKEDRLQEQLDISRRDISKLKAQVAEARKVSASHIEKDSKIAFLERENLQLMEDMNAKESEVRAAHEEMESLRLRVSDNNSTMDFGSVDLRSSKGRDRDSISSSSSLMAPKARSENTAEMDTMELMNMAVENPSGRVPSSSTKKRPAKTQKCGLSDATNSAGTDSVLPPSGKRQRSTRSSAGTIGKKPTTRGDLKSRASTKTPGLGESSTPENEDQTTECTQS